MACECKECEFPQSVLPAYFTAFYIFIWQGSRGYCLAREFLSETPVVHKGDLLALNSSPHTEHQHHCAFLKGSERI